MPSSNKHAHFWNKKNSFRERNKELGCVVFWMSEMWHQDDGFGWVAENEFQVQI